MNETILHDCSCGCKMYTYSHGTGPYVNLRPSTSAFVKYGIRGNHTKNCIFFNSELNSTFDTEQEAINAWNKIFE